jgi:hypothetical protein
MMRGWATAIIRRLGLNRRHPLCGAMSWPAREAKTFACAKREELFRAGERRLASDLGARGLDQASKRRRIGRGQVRQDLSVEIDPRLLETAHEG